MCGHAETVEDGCDDGFLGETNKQTKKKIKSQLCFIASMRLDQMRARTNYPIMNNYFNFQACKNRCNTFHEDIKYLQAYIHGHHVNMDVFLVPPDDYKGKYLYKG